MLPVVPFLVFRIGTYVYGTYGMAPKMNTIPHTSSSALVFKFCSFKYDFVWRDPDELNKGTRLATLLLNVLQIKTFFHDLPDSFH
jgi:hypothetical protein